MIFLLDPNICIYIIKQKPLSVWRRFQAVSTADIGKYSRISQQALCL
jgi:predicted nucleic acid-binding protein